ncbi:MAG: rRNA maturation RNase YbeY [Chitinophagaceae bacterium]|nr:rRNA maturation RNase YbeY [Chitinophagaceae bacterium]
MSKINFYFHDRKYAIKDRKGLKRALEHIFRKEKTKLQKLDYVFCSDDFLLDINKKFLKHNYFTDIITFDLSRLKNQVEGEVYISIDRVIDNAKTLKIPPKTELCRVIFHGALHLCGYSDKKRGEIEIMRAKEEEYLTYFLK